MELFDSVKLRKVWTAQLKFSSDKVHDIRMEIDKKGHYISGKLEFTSGDHIGEKYTISGRYHDALLTFYYYADDKENTSQGTATLERKGDQSFVSLDGYFAYYSQNKGSIDTTVCLFKPTSAR
ncbi:hypothetical protein GCM10027299_52470 [Larkinella ripae]